MATGIARMYSGPSASNVLRHHYSDLHKIISHSPQTRDSLANRYYQAHLIDLHVKSDITRSQGRAAADVLLEHLSLKVEQSSDYLPSVISIMGCEVSLIDVVQRMNDFRKDTTLNPRVVTASSLETTEENSSLDDTVREAENLKDAFITLVDDVMMAAKPIDTDRVKLLIGLHLQFARQNTPKVQAILCDLENQVTSADAAVRFLINRNLLGYLNFVLLDIFKKLFTEQGELVKKIESYQQQHDCFIQHNLKTLVSVFKQRPDLAPVSPVGLPEITVELEEPWGKRSLFQWREIMQDVGVLPDHLMIKSFRTKSIIIAYAILPFFLSTVVKQLQDKDVNKALVNSGAFFIVDHWVERLALSDIKSIGLIIEQANSILKQTRNTTSESLEQINIPNTFSLVHKEMEPIPQPAPKPPERGYDDDLFLDTPPEEYECPVCCLTLRDPHLLSCCGALICEFCKVHSGDRCPCCQNADHSSVLDKQTRGKILSLKVKCSSSECSWTGELLDLPAHKCPSAVVKCQYDCGEYFFASYIALHEQEQCPKRPYELIVVSHERQLAATSSSYEKMLMSKDETIRKLEKEKSASLKQLEKREFELTKKTSQSAETLAEAEIKISKLEEALRQKTVLLENKNTTYSYVTREFPSWYGPSAITNLHYVPPCILAMTNFTKHKLNNDSWYSPPFYTGPGGYKLQLRVDTAEGTHVSVRVYLMKGENDDCLGWPFKGSVAVKLFNWTEDKNHLEHSFSTTSAADPQTFNRVIDGVRAPGEMYQRQFIAHKELEFNSEKKTQYMMEDVLCFVISSVEILSSYQSSLVPDWAYPELSQLTYGVLPVYRTVKDFNKLKKKDDEYYSDSFYTAQGGYKLKLEVYPNGTGTGKGTHISLFICLMKGENDRNLLFPFSGILTIQLLNWKQDTHHVGGSVTFDETVHMKYRERVINRKASRGQGYSQYLSHTQLEKSSDIEYIHQDKLCFKIQLHPLFESIQPTSSPVPSWYDVINSESATPPCTRTLYNYTAYKRTNKEWWSSPFHSKDEGYKLQLRVYVKGFGFQRGTHLSLAVYLLKGEHDDKLQWPFNAMITIQLLNWTRDNNHKELTIHHHRAPLTNRTRVTEGERAPGGWGYSRFISHSDVEDVTSDTMYINNDAICFRIAECVAYNW